MLCFPIAANRGNSLSFKKVNYKISYTILDTQHLINELFDYLSLCYTVKIDKPMEETIKYNKKKFLYYENIFIIRKQDMYVKLYTDIKQQPYLFYRKKDNDYYIHIEYTRYVHDDDKIAELELFFNELCNKITLFAGEHNWKLIETVLERWKQ